MRLVYVIGVPGAGKTTAMHHALKPWWRLPLRLPFAHEVLVDPHSTAQMGAHLGVERRQFGGTDSLAMDVQPKVLAWLAEHPYPLVVGEGDRLANESFFDKAADLCQVDIVHLALPEHLAAARRIKRGSRQNEQWLRGRATKCARLARRATHTIDATDPEPDVAVALRHILLGERVPA